MTVNARFIIVLLSNNGTQQQKGQFDEAFFIYVRP